jgi:hypothetical protein
MDRNSLKQLRLDQRLTNRRAWISGKELAVELEKLPDVSDKMTTLGEAADRVEAQTGDTADTAAVAAPSSPSALENPSAASSPSASESPSAPENPQPE